MDYIAIILLALMAICGLVSLRNKIVLEIDLKQIRKISERAIAAIERDEPWEHLYQEFNNDDMKAYVIRVLDLTKWTHKQFYPE